MTYIVGSHWFICDVCGQKHRSTEKKKRWDGLIVCPADNEADHPQKYIRVESDGQAVPDPRPRPEDVFALPVYCTPVTRTAAADDGTADCMTVDYRLNINYADYGGYQPIVAPTPTPILLDTFTAADGTDPTTRDMNMHPSGEARWVFDASTSGVIRSNSLRSITGNVGDDCYLLYQLPASTEIFGTTPFATVIEAASFGQRIRLYGYNTAGTSELILNWVGDQLELYVSDESTNFAELFDALPNNGTQHAFAFWTDGTSQKLIIDGIESGSESILFSGISINWLRLELLANGTPETPDFINRVGIYNGLTLAEAIALTT